jgi:hypothetical protein
MVPPAQQVTPPVAQSYTAAQNALWETSFAQLVEFHRQHGQFCLAPDADHKALNYWSNHQRTLLNAGRLPPERRERLLALGFPGEPRAVQQQKDDCNWDRHFAELMAFHQQHGHFNVPGSDANCKFLKEWVNHMRRRKAAGKLKPERRQRLEAAGFAWFWGERRKPWLTGPAPKRRARKQGRKAPASKERSDAHWEQMFAQLRAFHLAHGHFNVPDALYRFRNTFALSEWVRRQCRFRLGGKLTMEQEQRLTALGFTWQLEWPEKIRPSVIRRQQSPARPLPKLAQPGF